MHCTAAREASSAAAASGSRQQRLAECGVRHNFQNYMQYGAETKERFLCQSKQEIIPPHPTHTHIKKHLPGYLFMETPYMDLRAGPQRGTTPIPEDDFCWDFFEMYYEMTGSSAKLDQWNTSFVGILLGQTPANGCLLYTSPSPRDRTRSRMPSSA